MKKIKTLTFLYIVVFSVFLISSLTYARTININVANFSFTPSTLTNAVVGDTIQWTHLSGSHTTTCNGTNGTSRPAGALPWDAELNSNSVTFKYRLQVAGTYNYVCVPHAPDMAGSIIATISSISQTTEIARGYEISQNYPNPFNPSTDIKFSVPVSGLVSLIIYDISGKTVSELLNTNIQTGSYVVRFDAADLPSGTYFYRLKTSDFTETKKMLLTK